MKKTLLIFAVTLCVLTACRSNRDRLMEINGFLNDNRLDTAQICLNKINPSDLTSYDEALYNLVTVKLNHLTYRPATSDTLIRSCINVFTKYDDKERLAESLYYQAVADYEEGHVPQAFTEMKKAEELAKDIDDLTIRHKIIESLTDWNLSEHQYQLAMNYGKQNLALSTMAKNDNWTAYALVFISQIHAGMDQRDSARYYFDKCITYMKDVPDSQRVDFYNYIAAVTMNTNLSTARSFVLKGIAIRENSMGYATLAMIRLREGNGDAVDSLSKKALHLAATPAERIYVLQQTMNLYEAQCRYDQAYQTSLKIMENKDYEALLREKHNVRNIQATYDYKMKDLRFWQYVFDGLFLIVILALFSALILLYYRYHMISTGKEVIQNQLLINIYSEQIVHLNASNMGMQSTIKSLSRKVSDLQKRQAKILYEGKKRYDHIIQGGTTVLWDTPDYAHFIEYYKILDFPFVVHLEKDYKHLSPQNQFFMILYQMGKDDKEVSRIIGINDSSIRSTKTRIKKDKK